MSDHFLTSLLNFCILTMITGRYIFSSTDPTSSAELCFLYCQIQMYIGFQCLPNLTTTTAAVATTTTATTTTASMTTTLVPCPSQYVGDPEMVLLCQLWQQLISVQQQLNSSSVIPAGVSSITCPYR